MAESKVFNIDGTTQHTLVLDTAFHNCNIIMNMFSSQSQDLCQLLCRKNNPLKSQNSVNLDLNNQVLTILYSTTELSGCNAVYVICRLQLRLLHLNVGYEINPEIEL